MINFFSSKDFLVGVLAGLVATGLSLGFRKFWGNVIVPWVEDRVYKDARIEGRWNATATFSETTKDNFILILHRHGHEVYGTKLCTEGPDKGREFFINGEFRNLILTSTYSSVDNAALDRGTLTLMLVENGDVLSGHAAYYDNIEHKVNTCRFESSRESR